MARFIKSLKSSKFTAGDSGLDSLLAVSISPAQEQELRAIFLKAFS